MRAEINENYQRLRKGASTFCVGYYVYLDKINQDTNNLTVE